MARHLDEYDFVLIDCPPALSLLTLNGLTAAHGVIIPMQCEYYALEGLSDLVNTIKQVHRNLNHELEIIGLLRVMFDPRSTLANQVSAQLESHFGDKVFRTVVPRNIRLAEAPSFGMPGVVFDKSSKGAQAYVAFAKEMVDRFRRRPCRRAAARLRRRGGAMTKRKARSRPRPRDAARRVGSAGVRRGRRVAARPPASTRCRPASTSRGRGWTRGRSPNSPNRSARRA